MATVETLTGATVEAVLARLGVDGVEPDRVGLDAVYLAWCHHVPFDNLVKRVDLVAQASRFRNDEPEAFFALWLAHGCGGTCWPSSRALGALLHTLGFEVRLGSAAMMDEIVGPIHSHGTVLARVGGEVLWVDSSMLTDAPVLLVAGEHTALEHPVRPVRVEPVDDRWRVRWRSGGLDMELGCLLLADDVDGAHYSARYEWSRENSPFNAGVYATVNRPEAVLSFAMGRRVVLDANGYTTGDPPTAQERRAVLVDEFGYSEELADALPPDALPPDDLPP